MSDISDIDVVIIGGGVGGYISALKGAQLGLKVVLIEKDQIGGVCLNRGCIPTKALVASAQIFEYLKNAEQYGLSAENISYNFKKIIDRKNRVVRRLTQGVQSLLKARNVRVIQGEAQIIYPGEIAIYKDGKKEEILRAKNIIIATGSNVRKVRIDIEANTENILDTDKALSLEELPGKILVVGGGYSGIEFASILNSFDVQIEVVDILERILLPVDEEIANSLVRILKKKGILFYLNSKVLKIAQKYNQLSVSIENEKQIVEMETEKVLISTGRIPNFGGIDIKALGIRLENGGIGVDKHMRTNIPGIYAVGDVVGKTMLAHVAAMQGQVAVQNIAGIDRIMSYDVIPFCVFSNPEVASVGLTEEEARRKLTDIKIFKFPYRANGKALTMDEREGYVKMIADIKNNQIAGIHIIGAHASDLIGEASLALQKGCDADDIIETIHAHPTLAEAIPEAAEGILGHPIHVLR